MSLNAAKDIYIIFFNETPVYSYIQSWKIQTSFHTVFKALTQLGKLANSSVLILFHQHSVKGWYCALYY